MNDYPCGVNDILAGKQVNKRKRVAFSMRSGHPLIHKKTLKPFEIEDFSKKIPPRQFYQNYRGDMVRVARLERAASTSQMSRATNCTTPGYFAVMIIARISCDSKSFPVCGHLCGRSGFWVRFRSQWKSRKRPCCKGFRALAVPIVDRNAYAPKAGALPTALHPVIKFPSGWAYSPKSSAIPPSLHPDIYFFLYQNKR